MNILCALFGHKPERRHGQFYVVCQRCPARMNLWTVGR